MAERPSDGPSVVSESHEHVWYHSGSCWPTSVSEVHGGHVLHMGLEAQVLMLRSADYVLCVNRADHLTRVGLLSSVTHFVRAGRLVCTNCFSNYMLPMVHLRLQAVRKDFFWKIVADWPSNGPIVISGPYEHVRHHFAGC